MENKNLVSGLGGLSGYGEFSLEKETRYNQQFAQIDVSSIFPDGFVIDGELYDPQDFFVSTHGFVQFGDDNFDYEYIYSNILFFGFAYEEEVFSMRPGDMPWIAPYNFNTEHFASRDIQNAGTVHVDLDTASDTVTVTWDRLRYEDRTYWPTFSFQLQMTAVSDSEMKITFRYGDMEYDDLMTWALIGADLGSQSFDDQLEQYTTPEALDEEVGNSGLSGVWEYTVSILPVLGTGADDDLVGTETADTIFAYQGDDTVFGLSGNDTIFGGLGVDFLDGDDGNDWISGGGGADTMIGGDGKDEMFGDAGNDTMHGRIGDDMMYGGAGNDVMTGGGGYDMMQGGDGFDTISGNDGNDDIEGNDGADTLYGDAGNDTINGGLNNDMLFGGDNDDLLIGNAGDDSLSGGAHRDKLYGGDGNDTLRGDAGADLLNGGSGADVFLFDSGKDLIVDFEVGIDSVQINLDLVGGAPVGLGALWLTAEVVGADTVFDFGDGNTLTFQGIAAPALLAGLIEFF